MDSLTINTNTTNLKLDEGKCEISWDLKGHQGWKEATLKKVKGVFAVVEYEEEGVLMSRVFHQSQVRKNLKRTITITPGDAYTLDISFIEENSGIENLIEGLKALMPIKFSLYFRSQVYIFGIENNEYNLNLLSYLTQTAKEHYVMEI